MKSNAFVLIGLVFAVLLVTCAVADEKTTSKEEKKVNADPKAEEVASKETENAEEVELSDTNWGGGRGGGWGGGRGCCGKYGVYDVEEAETNFRRRRPFRGRRPRRGGGGGFGGGVEEVEVDDTNYGGRPIWRRPRRGGGGGGSGVEEADANYYGGGWGGRGGGWGGRGGGYGGGGYGGGGGRGGGWGGHGAEP